MKEGEKMDKGGRGVPRPHTGLLGCLPTSEYTTLLVHTDTRLMRQNKHNCDN